MRWLWHELTRPRGRASMPFAGAGRRRSGERGLALLMVMASLAIITVITVELSYDGRVRLVKSAHERDKVAARYLAESGANIYRLILVADQQISGALGGMMPEGMNVQGLWQMLPAVNTGLMRMLFTSGGSVDDEEMEAFQSEGVTDEMREESREDASKFSSKGFLDFEGDFEAEIKDMDGRINVNRLGRSCPGRTCPSITELQQDPIAQQLYGLMAGEENDQWFYDRNIDRWEIIGNLADWIDLDTNRVFRGGYEDSLYQSLDDPYLSKNAQFDTVEEIRQVEGWQGEVYEKFGDRLTVYGAGKINVNSADNAALCGLLRAHTTTPGVLNDCDGFIERWQSNELITFQSWGKAEEFVTSAQDRAGVVIDDPKKLADSVSFESKTFLVESTGLVGDSVANLTVVIDFTTSKKVGRIKYWRMD